MTRMKPRRISVRCELETIRQAGDGVGILVDYVRHRHVQGDNEIRVAQHAQAAILALVSRRLILFDSLIAGDLDGADFAAPHNIIPESDLVEDLLIESKPRKER